MNDGYWGNYATGEIFLIHEHEMWIRTGNNADKLGISRQVQKKINNFIMRQDREKLLPFIFANAPVMRFRGHGSYVTMEFNCADWTKPLELVRKWCAANAGPQLGLNIINFATGQGIETTWENFELDKAFPINLNMGEN